MTESLLSAGSPPDFNSFIILVRIAERVLLTLFFIVTAAVIMIAYRKKIQNIDVNLSNEVGSVKTTASLVMPVFVLLTVILFSYVVLMHPINLQSPSTAQSQEQSGADIGESIENANTQSPETVFVGYGSGQDAEQKLTRDLTAVIRVAEILRRRSSTLPDASLSQMKGELDQLGSAARALSRMRDEILLEEFDPGLVSSCMPTPLDEYAPKPEPKCIDFNSYLSEN